MGNAADKSVKEWSARAKSNSYTPDRQAVRHSLGTEGANADYAAHDDKDWKQPQRKSEGRGFAPINKAAVPNTYTTGKGGSKRD